VSTFSKSTLNTIQGFASNLELEAQEADDGSFSFEFDSAGLATITPMQKDKYVLLSLKQIKGTPLQASHLKSFLSLACYDEILRQPITAGMALDEGLILVAHIPEKDFTLPMLETALDRLIELHNRA
jgi:hypothetical protein